MARVQPTPLVAVHQLTVLAHMLHYQAQLRTVEYVQHLMQADIDGLLQELRR